MNRLRAGEHLMTTEARDALDNEMKELRRQISLRDAALRECHKEIFKLREALMFSGLGSGAGHT
jgi:hypothetical protein